MSEEAEIQQPAAPTGTMQEAADKLKALRTPDPESQQEAAPEIDSDQSVAESVETESENTEESTEIEAQEVEQEIEQPEDTTDSVELDADQFAKLLQLEGDKLIIDDDNQIKFKTKVDGELGEVNLEQLIKSYQTEASNNNKSMQLAEMKKQQQDIIDKSNEYAQQQSQYAATILEAINQNFLTEVSQANLDQLRIDDPAEYSAKQIEFNQKRQDLQSLANQSLQMLNESNQAQEAEKQRLIQERIPVERQAMIDTFKPMKVEVTEGLQTDLTTYLTSQNYNNDEINNMIDHRDMVMAYKAMMFDKGTKTVTDKKVKKKLPKVLKSGQKPSSKAVNQAMLSKAVAKAKKSGSQVDALARLKASRQT